MTRRRLARLTAGVIAALGCAGACTAPIAAAFEGPAPAGRAEPSCAEAAAALEALRPRLEQLNPATDVITTQAPPFWVSQDAMRGRWYGDRPPPDLIARVGGRRPVRSAAACLRPRLPAGVKVVDPAVVSEELARFPAEKAFSFTALGVSYPVFNRSRDRALVFLTREVRGGFGSNGELALLARRGGRWRETGRLLVYVS